MTRRRSSGGAPSSGFLDALFVDDPPANVVLVHGPGGIGKSTLLRRVVQRGQEAGWTPLLVEGRDLPPVADALDDALARAHSFERPLVVLDTYERMEALGGHLRRERAARPARRARIVVIAGPRDARPRLARGRLGEPDRRARAGAAERGRVARAARRRSGVDDAARAAELAEWARGSPLALTLAARPPAADPDWSPAREGEPPEMVRALIAPAGRRRRSTPRTAT